MVDITPFKTLAEVIGLIIIFYTYFAKVVRFTDKQQKLEKEVTDLSDDTKKELTILTYGVLACLKGLKEQGADGPVTDAINKIEKHLNEKAHE